MRRLQVALLGAMCALAPRANAADARDFYLSLVGPSGVEIYSDQRLFTLYAAFNALGYDQGAVAREDPIPRPALSAMRAEARSALAMSPALQQRFQTFFDAHPQSRETYVAYVLSLGAAPGFAAPSGRGGLAGFEKLLAAYDAEAHVAQVYAKQVEPLRSFLKRMLAPLDKLCRDEDKLLPQSAAPSIALNVLDDVAAVGLSGSGADLVAFAGASPDAVEATLASAGEAYAAARALPILGAGGLPAGVADLVARVHKRGLPAGKLTPAAYVAEAYGAAVAGQVLPKQRQALLEAAGAQGLWLVQEFDRLLAEDRGRTPAETLLGPRLAQLDLRKVSPPPVP